MTVKVMNGAAAIETPLPAEKEVSPADAQPVIKAPAVYIPEETPAADIPRSYRRRRTGSFGDILFVQLILSVLLGAGLWAGKVFGSGEVSALCERIAELFR